MGIEYFIFALYLALVFWCIPHISFIKKSGLSKKDLRLLLGFKIIAGLACAFYFQKVATNVDYVFYNAEGQVQYQLLISDPKLFFADVITDLHAYGLGGLFDSSYSFWAAIRFNLIYKFIAILDLISHGNFYLNTSIFCSILFFGNIAFYRVYSEMYITDKLKVLFACFCLPSLLLYTSCVNKDGMIFLFLALLSFILHRALSLTRSVKIKHLVYFLVGTIIIFLIRNYVLVAMVPALIVAILCRYLPFRKRFTLAITYGGFCLLFFLTGLNKSFFNLPAAVVQRKADFAVFENARTNIPMNELYPSLQSFILNLPQAVNHYLMRPYLWEFSIFGVFLTALELLFYQAVVLAFIFFRKKNNGPLNDFNLFGFAFFINMMLIIGYTIPNIGAIVRYRSIFWIFFICPLLCNTDWKKMLSFHKSVNRVI